MQQLFDQCVRKVCLPAWNKFAYIQLHEVNNALMPWARLYDLRCNGDQLPAVSIDNDTYEAYPEIPNVTEEELRTIYEAPPYEEYL